MKSRQFFILLAIMIVVSAGYRLVDARPLGFAPQIALALFGGAVFVDKKLSFLLPMLSLFLGDLFFQLAYIGGFTAMPGFYEGQWVNYLLFAGLTVLGFFINKQQIVSIASGLLAGPVMFFFFSNTAVWLGGGGFGHPKTFAGWNATLADGVPFFAGSLMATLLVGGLLFGGYALLQPSNQKAQA